MIQGVYDQCSEAMNEVSKGFEEVLLRMVCRVRSNQCWLVFCYWNDYSFCYVQSRILLE